MHGEVWFILVGQFEKLETDYAATNPMKYVEYYASGCK